MNLSFYKVATIIVIARNEATTLKKAHLLIKTQELKKIASFLAMTKMRKLSLKYSYLLILKENRKNINYNVRKSYTLDTLYKVFN
jgi:hypothetical protein